MDNCLVISGASKGIGLATAEKFLSEGFRVINLSRSECPNQAVQQVYVDMENPEWVEEQGEKLIALIGRPEKLVVIHNAALLQNDSIKNVAQKAFQKVMQLNVIAPAQLNQLALDRMEPGSAILYVGSTLSEKAVANSCSYVTSKHAIAGLMKATCQDLAGSGIHTACVCPGFTETEMLREHVGGDEAILADIATGVTFGRLIKPEEIAETLYFAANNPVSNGAVWHVNLGQVEH